MQQEFSQNEPAELAGISQSTISSIENGRIRLDVERAKVLPRALICHPAVLALPGWDLEQECATWQPDPRKVLRPRTDWVNRLFEARKNKQKGRKK